MTIRVDNLYLHEDGGYYCLLCDDVPLKCPASGDWLPGVTYLSSDGKMRSTTLTRWQGRFSPVAEYDGGDEEVLAMIRRANPGDTDFDFIRVMEGWHESEMSITGHMLELAVAAAVEKYEWPRPITDAPARFGPESDPVSVEITIMSEDLQRVVQTYEIERVPIPHGFTFRITKE